MTFFLALAAALVFTPVVLALARRWRLIDVPNHRSAHTMPVPRGGGIAVVAATIMALAIGSDWTRSLAALVVGAVALAAVGFADDRWSLPALPRLVAQIVTPLVIGVAIADQLSAWLVVAAVVVAGYVNAFNFMDGINGISGSQAAIAGAFLAAVADSLGSGALAAAGWAVSGASLGFLPYNAVQARIFLGDVGSYFLGFWLAGLALLVVDAGAPAVVVVGPFLLYLLDTSTVLLRRARRGDSLTEAHREHAYQRLTQAGWSHPTASTVCATVAGACAVIMYLVIDDSLPAQLVALAASCALVAGYLALPGLLQDRATDRGVA